MITTDAASKIQFNSWKAMAVFIAMLRSIRNEHSRVNIDYFDPSHFPFADRLASAFESAGWSVNFNKTAQSGFNPWYVGGIEVRGDNRNAVEAIVQTLVDDGVSARSAIGATQIKPSNAKYATARNTISIKIGYDDRD